MRLTKAQVLIVSLILLASFVPSAHGLTAFTDDFEAGGAAWDDLWDGNGATTWTQGQAGEGEAGHTPHGGSNDAWCDSTGTLLTSDDIDLSTATSASLSFWYYLDDTEASDLNLYLYDGVAYDLIAGVGGGAESTWLQYTIPSLDSQYFISNFRIRFDGTGCASGENVFVDDMLVSYVATAEYSRSASQALTWAGVASRTAEYERVAAQELTWGGVALRLVDYGRSATQVVAWGGTASRLADYARGAVQSIGVSGAAQGVAEYVRIAVQGLTFYGSINTVGEYLRGASQTLSVGTSIGLAGEYLRGASQSLVTGFDSMGGILGVYNAVANLILYIKASDGPAPGGSGPSGSLLIVFAGILLVVVLSMRRGR